MAGGGGDAPSSYRLMAMMAAPRVETAKRDFIRVFIIFKVINRNFWLLINAFEHKIIILKQDRFFSEILFSHYK